MINFSARHLILLALAICGFGMTVHQPPVPADVELILPPGFKAESVVESLGSNRHLAVNSNGDIYVKLERLKDGKGIFVLRNNNGKYDVIKSFGNYTGTGIVIHKGYLYATSDREVFRYKFNANN